MIKKLTITTAILAFLLAPTALADNFSANHSQSQFGEFSPVLDESVAFSQDNVQGVFGEFRAVFDDAAGAAAAAAGSALSDQATANLIVSAVPEVITFWLFTDSLLIPAHPVNKTIPMNIEHSRRP